MQKTIYNINFKRLAFAFVLASMCITLSAYAEEKELTPPKLVYDQIPAKWNYYFVQPALIEKFTGEELKKVCFNEDFKQDKLLKENQRYLQLKVKAKRTGNARFTSNTRYRLMTGGRDFIVIDKKHMLVSTPNTGVTLIETRYGCDQKALARAKYLNFRDDLGAKTRHQCIKPHKGLPVLTRRYTGAASCKIKALYKWTGSTNIQDLMAQSDALKIQNPNEK